MRPEPGQVLYFSEDPTITHFVPPRSADGPVRHVLRLGGGRGTVTGLLVSAPLSPGDGVGGRVDDRRGSERIIGPGGGNRVHAFEYGWLDMMRTVRLFTLGWRQPRSSRSAHLSRTRTWQRGQWRHGDRRNRSAICRGSMNEEAGIQLRVLNNLWPYRDAVITSTVGYSGIRLRHATPRR